MTIKTIRVNSNGNWLNVEEICNISLVADNIYLLQCIGDAKLCYTSSTPETSGYITVTDNKPFNYTHTSGNKLFINATNCLFTISF